MVELKLVYLGKLWIFVSQFFPHITVKDVVMRILMQSEHIPTLKDLGFERDWQTVL